MQTANVCTLSTFSCTPSLAFDLVTRHGLAEARFKIDDCCVCSSFASLTSQCSAWAKETARRAERCVNEISGAIGTTASAVSIDSNDMITVAMMARGIMTMVVVLVAVATFF